MSKLVYNIEKSSLKQAIAIALDVCNQCGLKPVAVEHGTLKLNFSHREALKLVAGTITEGDYIKLAGYLS